ncbi:MAG: OmpA family protein [Arenicella sp.]|nr:OmpA family protein [Arenicella sp.]
MNRKLGLIMTVLMGLVLTACASNEKQVVETESTKPVVVDTANVDRNAYGSGYSVSDLASQFGIDGDPLNYKVLYFKYNSSAIDERSRIIATRHAQYLGEKGGLRVNLEGHADERGTRDFNLALGERRAQTVAQLMNTAGASSAIETISYGEERPVNVAHTETAWKANRRVGIKY